MKLPPEFILEIDLEGIDLVEQAAPLNPFFHVSHDMAYAPSQRLQREAYFSPFYCFHSLSILLSTGFLK